VPQLQAVEVSTNVAAAAGVVAASMDREKVTKGALIGHSLWYGSRPSVEQFLYFISRYGRLQQAFEGTRKPRRPLTEGVWKQRDYFGQRIWDKKWALERTTS
jgi:hypothetical protein